MTENGGRPKTGAVTLAGFEPPKQVQNPSAGPARTRKKCVGTRAFALRAKFSDYRSLCGSRGLSDP